MEMDFNGTTTTADLARLAEENTALIENSLDLIALIDADGRFLRLNAATFDILGYRPEELVGRRYDELLDEQERAWFQALRSEMRSGVSIRRDIEHRWMRKDGRPIIMSSSVRWCALSQVTYATARDVTEQHAARAALDKSQQQLQVMLESIGDAFFAVDREWRVTFANRKAGHFVNVDAALAIGRNLLEVAPDLRGSPALDYYRRAMETGGRLQLRDLSGSLGRLGRSARLSERGRPVGLLPRHQLQAPGRAGAQEKRAAFPQPVPACRRQHRDRRPQPVHRRRQRPRLHQFRQYQEEFLRLRVPDIDSGHTYSPELAGCWTTARPSSCASRNGARTAAPFRPTSTFRASRTTHQFFQAIIRDVTEREETQNRLRELATHDTLTGLPNRRCWASACSGCSMPRARCAVATMFIDLDRFKEVNDSFGHGPVTILLCEVAARLRGLRPGDFIARLGGDEFVVRANCANGKNAAARIVEKLLDALPRRSHRRPGVTIGASIGISLFPCDGSTKEQLFQGADTAMYRAKAGGRNVTAFLRPRWRSPRGTDDARNSLRRALARGEFELHYQPRIDLRSRPWSAWKR